MLSKIRNSIVTKTTAIHVFIFAAVSVIVLISVLQSLRVQNRIEGVIDRDVSAILANAHLGRSLNSAFAEANLLLTTFPEKNEYLKVHQSNLKQTLQQQLQVLREDEENEKVRKSLNHFIGVLNPLLDQCVKINSVFSKVRQSEDSLEKELQAVDEILVERTLQRRSDETLILQHLGAMLSVYRETLFRLTIRVDDIKEAFLSGQGNREKINDEVIGIFRDFISNLYLVGTSGRDFVPHGENLLKLADEYQQNVLMLTQVFDEFQTEMRRFQEAQKQVNQVMANFDSEIADTASRIQAEVKDTTRTSLIGIALVSTGILAGLAFLTILIRKMVAPISPLALRARAISLGNYTTDISTDSIQALLADRHDEISELAKDFEEMRVRVQDREKALQDSQSVLTATLESTQEGVLVIDEAGKVSHHNKKFTEIWKIPADLQGMENDDELIDYVLSQLADPEQFRSKIVELYASSKSSDDIIDLIDGRILARFSCPLLKADREAGRVWFFRDITQQRKAEETLKYNFIQLQSIYNRLPVVIWAVDKNGIFTLSEGKELEVLGLKPGQVVGQSIFEIYEGNSLILDYTQRAINGESCEYIAEVMGIYYHTFNTPFYDENNEVLGINGLAINVTEAKKTEEEIRRLRNYLSNIINSMPSVLIGVDDKINVTQWNREAQRLTGISAEVAIGKELQEVFPQLTNEIDQVKDAMQSREVRFESRQSRKEDNKKHYEDITIFPLITNGVDGAVVRIDDVTEKVRLEEIMIQSEKMLTVGGLAAGMAHEINNPMAGMLQSAWVMGSRLKDEFDIEANQKAAEAAGTTLEAIEHFMRARGIHRMINTIVDSGQRVVDVVNNMLSFARKTDEGSSSHDLADLLDKTLALATTDYDLKKQYDFKKIDIVKEYAPDLPSVPCHATKIQQVLLNVFSNGAHAMQASKTENPRLTIKTYADSSSNFACIEIKDNGPGMDESTRKRVFDPFFTTKPQGQGTGLGLSVSYFIITENHNGEMLVETQPGAGAKFIIRLPIKH